jgi:hypothetical protein
VSRRALQPRAGRVDQRAARMAPGGRLWSESRLESLSPSLDGGDGGLCNGYEMYPDVYMPDPTSITKNSNGVIIDPTAVGMPASDIGSQWATGGFLGSDNGTIAIISVVPGIAPGSTNAYRFSYQAGRFHSGVGSYLGLNSEYFYPNFSTTTYLRIHGWIKPGGLVKTGSSYNQMFRWVGIVGNYGVITYELVFSSTDGWYLYWEIDSEDDYVTYQVPLPAFNGIDGFQNGMVYEFEMYMDTLEKTCTVSVNGVTTQVYNTNMWPSGDYWAKNVSPQTGLMLFSESDWTHNVSSAIANIVVDQMRIETDTQWCPVPEEETLLRALPRRQRRSSSRGVPREMSGSVS